jgi:hypothetical protein
MLQRSAIRAQRSPRGEVITIACDGDRGQGRRGSRDDDWRSSGRRPSHEGGGQEAIHDTRLHAGQNSRGSESTSTIKDVAMKIRNERQ